MIQFWGITDVGAVRAQNQDAFYTNPIREDLLLAIVCDGMGGAKAGNVASSLAVATASDYLEDIVPDKLSAHAAGKLCEACRISNRAVFKKACREPECRGMGTTMVCAVISGGKADILNVGDSRAYHINGEGIRQISRDHSVVESMVEKGDITPQEARRHPNRNLITRALGPDIQAQADTFAVAWHPGDFILLCTDGLVNTVSDQEMLFEVLHDGDIESCLDHLMQISLRRGAPDNVTVVLLMNA